MEQRKLMVTSSKGGIGKSTVSAGLALALCGMGRRVLLVDCDFGNCCLDMLLGVEDRVLFTLGDLSELRAEPEDVLLHPEVPGGENLFFCAAPRGGCPLPDEKALLSSLAVLEEAVSPEIILLDTAAGIELPHTLAASYATGALVVASQMPVSLRAAENTARALAESGLPEIRLVINCFEPDAARYRERAGLLEMIDKTAIRTVGVVPRDRELMLAQENGRPPRAKSPAAIAFNNIARRLTGENVRLFCGIRGMRARRFY